MNRNKCVSPAVTIIIIVAAAFAVAFGQDVSISGTVKNKATNTPVSGVLVTLEGTAISGRVTEAARKSSFCTGFE